MSNKVLNKDYVYRQFSRYNTNCIDTTLRSMSNLVNSKVDVVAGYGLSKNNFTTALKTKLEGLSNYDDTQVRALIAANTAALNTLNGSGNGSVTKIVTDRLNDIINNAPETFDTLREISDWIDTHDSAYTSMLSAVNKNASDISNLKEQFAAFDYELEDTDIDFASDNELYRFEWVKVVPDSVTFVGGSVLTNNLSDYTIDLISCGELFNGTVYTSETVTAYLSDITAVDCDVRINVDKNLNTARITVTGICANSNTYTPGKVDTIVFELHEWSHVTQNSLAFNNANYEIDEYTLTDDLDDYTISAMLSRETDSSTIVTSDADTVNLTTVRTTGADVSVDLTVNKNSRTSSISISGHDINSSSYTGNESSLEYTMRDWFVVNDNTLASTSSTLTNNKSDYTVQLVHYLKNHDGTYTHSDPLTVTLAEAEILGLSVTLTFTEGGNGRKAVVRINGVDIGSTTYTGNESTVTHTLEDWYSIDDTSITHTANGDLTSSTSDYSVDVTRHVGKDGILTDTDSTITLAQAISLGFGATVSINTSTSNGAVTRTANITITGKDLSSTQSFTNTSESTTESFTDHEWYDTDFATSLAFTGNGDLTTLKSDYSLTLAYVKEDNSGIIYSNETVTLTLAECDAAGLTTTLNVTASNGSKTAAVTVSGTGISDNSQHYTGTTSTKSFELHSWIYVDDTVRFNGNSGLTTAISDYEVDVYNYVNRSSNSSTGTMYASSTKTLNQLSTLGLTATLSDVTATCSKDIQLSISGSSITSNTSFSSTVATRNYELHEWIALSNNSVFDASNVTSSGDYSSCTVSGIGRIVETDSDGETEYLELNQTYTIDDIEAENVSCTITSSTNADNTGYVVTTSLVMSGTNLNSDTCVNAVQSKRLQHTANLVYTTTATTVGSGITYDQIAKWDDES